MNYEKIRLNKTIYIIIVLTIALIATITVSATSKIKSKEVSYNNENSHLSSTNVQNAIYELYINNCQDSSDKIGDYITIQPTTNQYTIESKYTGYTDSEEIIYPSELTLWRIIKQNDDGTYDAIADEASSTQVTFKGTVGYQSYVYYLNKLASLYENPKYTTGSRYFGFNNQVEFISDTHVFDGTSNDVEWKRSAQEIDNFESYEYLGIGDTKSQQDINLVNETYQTLDANIHNSNSIANYWVASRKYTYVSYRGLSLYYEVEMIKFANNKSTKTIFPLREYQETIYNSNTPTWTDEQVSSYLRPIITISSKLTPIGGTGTKEDAYIYE